MEAVHAAAIKGEPNGLKDSKTRLENMNRRGLRLFGHERLDALLVGLRPPTLSEAQYRLVRQTSRAVLAHAGVAVMDERYTGRKYLLYKQALQEADW